ncbi:MAG: glucose-6-phosphate dehydrogenase assembly protein OpcA [Solirubrobacteraceae bacterium]
MSDDVWSERDTTPGAIESALRGLLRERHAANHGLAPARVLNLIVVVDREWKGEIANRLARVGRYHASRTVLCAVEDGRESLDARAVMSYEDPTTGLGVIHEQIEIDLGSEHLSGLETIVDPVLASELPTMLWSPHGFEEAVQALRPLLDVMLIDSDQEPEAGAAMARAVALLESVYVVDLAWLRTTPWRERLAASFDPSERRAALDRINGVEIRHRAGSTVSALLLAGWLGSRLGWRAQPLRSRNGAGMRGVAGLAGSGIGGGLAGSEVGVEVRPTDQEAPGLAGVTISCAGGFALSLDRTPGGLCARERARSGDARTWQVLGASRGEGGILGEGVRQALLRDPTYGPALDVAHGFCPG